MFGASYAACCRNRILNLFNDSHRRNHLRRASRAGLRQLPERVPEPLARGRKHRASALALSKLRENTSVVGKRAAGKLAGAARALPELPGMDWLALSTGGAGGWRRLGFGCVSQSRDHHRSCTF
jgi:hypothetical protein